MWEKVLDLNYNKGCAIKPKKQITTVQLELASIISFGKVSVISAIHKGQADCVTRSFNACIQARYPASNSKAMIQFSAWHVIHIDQHQ